MITTHQPRHAGWHLLRPEVPDTLVGAWHEACQRICRGTAMSAAGVWRCGQGMFRLVTAAGEDAGALVDHPEFSIEDGGPYRTALTQTAVVRVADLTRPGQWRKCPEFLDGQFASVWIAPIVWPDRSLFGVLSALNRDPRAFSMLDDEIIGWAQELLEHGLDGLAAREYTASLAFALDTVPTAVRIAAPGGASLHVNRQWKRTVEEADDAPAAGSAAAAWESLVQEVQLQPAATEDGRVRWTVMAVNSLPHPVRTWHEQAQPEASSNPADAGSGEEPADARLSLNHAGDPVLVCSPDGRIQTVNEAAGRLLHYSGGELCGMTLNELTVPDPGEPPLDLAGIEPGKPLFMRRRLQRKDGVRIPVELSLNASEAAGKPIVTGVVRELLREPAAARAAQWERDLFLGGPVALVRRGVRPPFPIMYASDNFTGFGQSPAGLLASEAAYLDLMHPEDRDAFQRAAESAWRAGREMFIQDYRLLDVEGAPVHVFEYTVFRRGQPGGAEWMDGYLLKTPPQPAAMLKFPEGAHGQ